MLAALLLWWSLASPLSLRQPVPSPDGQYFAYFDPAGGEAGSEGDSSNLILAAEDGTLIARFPNAAGQIAWSNADHLTVVDAARHRATVIARLTGMFVKVTTLTLEADTEPVWALSGTKLAYIRPGTSGPEIAIFDLLEPETGPVPLPARLTLTRPRLLFWSPGALDLFFLNRQDSEVALSRVNVFSGEVLTLARARADWAEGVSGPPQVSADGTRIFLPPPVNGVINTETGETLWTLPPSSVALPMPWSGQGNRLYYTRPDRPGEIFAHDFQSGTDRMLVSDAAPNGFFSADGASYFFRASPPFRLSGYGEDFRRWFARDWDWRQVDVPTHTTQALGRSELWPWARTRQGNLLMSRDTRWRVDYGLYDPDGRVLSPYVFPSRDSDFPRQMRGHVVVLLTTFLYGLLGLFIFVRRSTSAPARALYLLCLNLMLLFASLAAVRAAEGALAHWDFGARQLEWLALGWIPLRPRSIFMLDQAWLLVLALSLLPVALLHLTLDFPEGNRFPVRHLSYARIPLYVVALVPVAGAVSSLGSLELPGKLSPLLVGLMTLAGGVVIITALLALLYSYRKPPDRRARDQVRWVALAFTVPLVGMLAIVLVDALFHTLLVQTSHHTLDVLTEATLSLLFLFTPMAIGYSLVAHKLFDIHLLARRTIHYTALLSIVVIVYALLVGGLSLLVSGTVINPSSWVVLGATLLTVALLGPFWTRLEARIDRTFNRAQYASREAIQTFANNLPNLLDRAALAKALGRVAQATFGAKSMNLFVLDRKTGKLRPEPGSREAATALKDVEFDQHEPLCRFLLERQQPFEVEISPYNPELIPVFRTAADRLGKLGAAVIQGLIHRGQLIGLMSLGTKLNDEFYNSEDLASLKTLATHAATAVENTELFEEVAHDREMKKELEVAGEVQAQLFPSVLPVAEGCEIAGQCVPASTVSGDYYDILELPGHKIALALGDVSGKGVSASLLMANLQGLLRTQAPIAEDLPGLVRRINRQLFASSRGGKYCSFFYAVYDPHQHSFEYVNAGHNPPVIVGPRGVRTLESTGVPLGLFPEVTHDVRQEALEPGAVAVIYSDGLTEARNSREQLFGLTRLVTMVKDSPHLEADELLKKILSDVREFAGNGPVEDDRTLVLLKVAEP